MMSFGAKPDTAGVLVPDHTHWGNEGGLLARVSDGKGISGWEAQHNHLKVRRQDLAVINPEFEVLELAWLCDSKGAFCCEGAVQTSLKVRRQGFWGCKPWT